MTFGCTPDGLCCYRCRVTAPILFWSIFTAAAIIVSGVTALVAYRKSRRNR